MCIFISISKGKKKERERRHRVMDDIQNVGNGEYICADEIEKLSAFKQFTLSLNILAAMVPNVIIALTLAAYSVLKHVYYLMFSKPLNSIRGQLAVVI